MKITLFILFMPPFFMTAFGVGDARFKTELAELGHNVLVIDDIREDIVARNNCERAREELGRVKQRTLFIRGSVKELSYYAQCTRVLRNVDLLQEYFSVTSEVLRMRSRLGMMQELRKHIDG